MIHDTDSFTQKLHEMMLTGAIHEILRLQLKKMNIVMTQSKVGCFTQRN